MVSCICCGFEFNNEISLRRHYRYGYKEMLCSTQIWLITPFYKMCKNPTNNKKCTIYCKPTVKHGLCKSCSGRHTYNGIVGCLTWEERYGVEIANIKKQQSSEFKKQWFIDNGINFKGENGPNFGKKWSLEQRQKASITHIRLEQSLRETMGEEAYLSMRRKNAQKMMSEESKNKANISKYLFYKNVKSNKSYTLPERLFCKILEDLNIKFEFQHLYKYYSFDFYLIDFDIFIEVDGDYWHANPNKYTTLNETQKNNLINDKRKNTLLANENRLLLRFWETDIKFNSEKVINEIKTIVNDFKLRET